MINYFTKFTIQHLTWLLLLSALFHTATAFSATITAEVSRNPVSIDESFELSFTAQGDVDAVPDFSPLEQDFQILQRSQNQNIQMINGRYSRNTRWLLSLMAKRSGDLQIPAIAFGSNQSQPLKLLVSKTPQANSGSSGNDIFLEVSLDPKMAYVHQQLIYRVRLFRSVNIADAGLTEPSSSDPDAIIEQLGDEQSYETRRHGKRYLVNEINYAIFPQHSGNMIITPPVFQARLLQQQSRGHRSPFNVFEQAGPLKRWRAKPIGVQVKPIPDSAEKPWLPAVAVHLSEKWPQDEPEFRVGEPITRTLRLQALGASSSQLPAISMSIPDGFKQYPDKPAVQDHKTSNGITGIREEKIAMVPTTAGNFILPAIVVAWWNTEADRLEVARLSERHIRVQPALDTKQHPSAPVQPTLPQSSITPAAANQPLPEATSKRTTEQANRDTPYHWLSLFLAVGWLITAVTWWRSHKRRTAQQPAASEGLPADRIQPKQALAELKQACKQHNAPAAHSAILKWGQAHWGPGSLRNLSDLAGRLDQKAAIAIKELEQALYGREPKEWDGTSLWESIKDYKMETEGQAEGGTQLLPLHPG